MRRLMNWLAYRRDRFVGWLDGPPASFVDTPEPPSPTGPITSIPSGSDTINFSFKVSEGTYKSLDNLFAALKKRSVQARMFDHRVKYDHRVPALDAETYKAAGATNIHLELQPSGNYKIAMVMFKDRSIWSAGGHVHDG